MITAKSKARPAKSKDRVPAVGDTVLLGGTRASYPNEWYDGIVLWVGASDILVERSTRNGQTYRQQCDLGEVRAIGSRDDLYAIKRQAAEAVATLREAIRDAEHALGRARDALFAKLDELAAGGLKIIPPNFSEMDANRCATQAIMERIDLENEVA